MKKLALAFCLTLCSQILFAQQISVMERGSQDPMQIDVSYSDKIRQVKVQGPNAEGIELLAFLADQKILDNRNVYSFKDLMGHFKGKKVFVDMWATWCGPCKEEFRFNPGLKDYLKANGVEMLYISMDNLKADKQWREMIKYYGLSGTHIRAADALKQDLLNLFWDGKSYSIPRYLIVKDGVVVEKSALRPSDGQKLYDQIGK